MSYKFRVRQANAIRAINLISTGYKSRVEAAPATQDSSCGDVGAGAKSLP
jgi:hypothetical protein